MIIYVSQVRQPGPDRRPHCPEGAEAIRPETDPWTGDCRGPWGRMRHGQRMQNLVTVP